MKNKNKFNCFNCGELFESEDYLTLAPKNGRNYNNKYSCDKTDCKFVALKSTVPDMLRGFIKNIEKVDEKYKENFVQDALKIVSFFEDTKWSKIKDSY